MNTEYPPRAQLRELIQKHPLPSLTPDIIAAISRTEDNNEATTPAAAILALLNYALACNNPQLLEACFFPAQAYWKDQLGLTYHLRTFTDIHIIVAALLETSSLRELDGGIRLHGAAKRVVLSPSLQFIDCPLVFRTNSPPALCKGRIIILPTWNNEQTRTVVEWKIWILNTRLEDLDVQPEDERLLRAPSRQLNLHQLDELETSVFIIGGGNAAAALAARLKALGVDSVMAERNAQAGDNWARRYDCLHFHLPTAVCDMPYMPYPPELRGAHYLSRDELATHLRQYIQTLGLNYITSVLIDSTHYCPLTERWIIKFKTPAGKCTAIAKHLVLATGIGSQKPNVPRYADSHIFRGTNMHSVEYTNAQRLLEQGIKSVLIIGSANTAFDILTNCHNLSLTTTLVSRSPTYILPASYLCHPHGLGAYETGVQAADTRFLTLPTIVDAQFTRTRLLQLAKGGNEPARYTALAKAGFQVIDSAHPDALLGHHFLERAGGHYIDTGGTELIASGGVRVRAGVEPVAYTRNGVRLSDGSVEEADCIIFCTGFADTDIRDGAVEILQGTSSLGIAVTDGARRIDMDIDGRDEGNTTKFKDTDDHPDGHFLGPATVAALLDATWGVDEEGEIRGMWKRHLRLDNIWVTGGHTQQHRWYSRILALQIKAAVEGILPRAYMDTP
ncbi:hypothetical protein BJX63DRAFT_421085 [Aspergillus granulosus]|uniref:FAD/NAD(P)-binding domain-containing protein n=1 Tax=Aspergillus granulosus TaxID=176169 RepID=A0ABR4HEI1_9EURO